MHSKLFLLILSACALTLVACSGSRSEGLPVAEGNRYATGFRIEQRDSVTHVEVYSPWAKNGQREVMAEYTITRPIHRIATASCTHVGFLDALGKLGSVVAVCNKDLVFTPLADSVLDAGDSMTPNVETMMLAAVDAVMVSTYAQGDEASERLKKLGLQVIYNNEWMEASPLARAEWIRFVAAFYDCLPLADSLFSEVVTRYQSLATRHSPARPLSIMTGNNFRGTWYVPSGNTYMGNLFSDAGAVYPFYDNMRNGSIPLTVEQVVSFFADADVWVGSNARSLDELARMDDKHTWFRAYHQARVYNWYKQTRPGGANNFWERGVVHPEEILSDLITILYGHDDESLNYAEHLP